MAEVLSEVEAGVLDEDGMGQAEGDRHDLPPKCRELVEPGGEVPAQALKGERVAGACPEYPEGDALHRLFGHLQAEESCVQTAQPAHGWIRRWPETQGSSFLWILSVTEPMSITIFRLR
jgi:hypothetical protein